MDKVNEHIIQYQLIKRLIKILDRQKRENVHG